MKIKSIIFTAVFVCLIMPLNASAHQQNAGKHFILNLVGNEAKGYDGFVPDIAKGDEPMTDPNDVMDDPATCFDVDLVNAKNNVVIGSATDCLSNITPVGTGLALTGTTIFNMPGGTLMTRGNTTVQPVLQDTATIHGLVATHITGAAGKENAVLSGTGRYAGATGTVRLSGIVDLSVAGQISFDCLFEVDLD